MSGDHVTSTGRGGAGNIGHDDQVYTDGSIIREGEGTGPTGRGGFGNTASPRLGPVDAKAKAPEGTAAPAAGKDTAAPAGGKPDIIVPDVATTTNHQSDFHTGRGGKGNVHRDKYGGHSTKREQEEAEQGTQGIAAKLKKLLGLSKKDKGKDKVETGANGTS